MIVFFKKTISDNDIASKIETYNQYYTLILIIIIIFINHNYIKVSKENENDDVNFAIGQFIVFLFANSKIVFLIGNFEKQFDGNDLKNSEV